MINAFIETIRGIIQVQETKDELDGLVQSTYFEVNEVMQPCGGSFMWDDMQMEDQVETFRKRTIFRNHVVSYAGYNWEEVKPETIDVQCTHQFNTLKGFGILKCDDCGAETHMNDR